MKWLWSSGSPSYLDLPQASFPGDAVGPPFLPLRRIRSRLVSPLFFLEVPLLSSCWGGTISVALFRLPYLSSFFFGGGCSFPPDLPGVSTFSPPPPCPFVVCDPYQRVASAFFTRLPQRSFFRSLGATTPTSFPYWMVFDFFFALVELDRPDRELYARNNHLCVCLDSLGHSGSSCSDPSPVIYPLPPPFPHFLIVR